MHSTRAPLPLARDAVTLTWDALAFARKLFPFALDALTFGRARRVFDRRQCAFAR
jgi:hypothetical protein